MTFRWWWSNRVDFFLPICIQYVTERFTNDKSSFNEYLHLYVCKKWLVTGKLIGYILSGKWVRNRDRMTQLISRVRWYHGNFQDNTALHCLCWISRTRRTAAKNIHRVFCRSFSSRQHFQPNEYVYRRQTRVRNEIFSRVYCLYICKYTLVFLVLFFMYCPVLKGSFRYSGMN